MPKAPRDKETTTPKKRTRKATSSAVTGVAPENGNGVETAQAAVVTSPEIASRAVSSPNLEEKIRVRAYELYLQRAGHGGSPEQDWARAVEEICGQQRTV